MSVLSRLIRALTLLISPLITPICWPTTQRRFKHTSIRPSARRVAPLPGGCAAACARRGRVPPQVEGLRSERTSSIGMSWGLWTGGFPGASANCETLPKMYNICGFSNFAGNARKLSNITGKFRLTPRPEAPGHLNGSCQDRRSWYALSLLPYELRGLPEKL